jgi:hypothetical protein
VHLTGELEGGKEALKSFNCSLGRRHLTLLFARLSLDNKFEILIRRERALAALEDNKRWRVHEVIKRFQCKTRKWRDGQVWVDKTQFSSVYKPERRCVNVGRSRRDYRAQQSHNEFHVHWDAFACGVGRGRLNIATEPNRKSIYGDEG